MALFCLALAVPMGYFVIQSYGNLRKEEASQVRYFAETIFQGMETDLADLVVEEERRGVEDYQVTSKEGRSAQKSASPLATHPARPFILGYLQNNPDGSFQTPMDLSGTESPSDLSRVMDQLTAINQRLTSRVAAQKAEEETVLADSALPSPKESSSKFLGFADKYIDTQKAKKQKSSLGQEKKWREQITPEQALTFSKKDDLNPSDRDQRWDSAPSALMEAAPHDMAAEAENTMPPPHTDLKGVSPTPAAPFPPRLFEAEIAPLQSMFISDDEIFIFRRVMINDRIFRQGFVLLVPEFLRYLSRTHFDGQPMAAFSRLRLDITDHQRDVQHRDSGSFSGDGKDTLRHRFPRPFSFLTAHITLGTPPPSAGRTTLTVMLVLTAMVIGIGLFAIYQSARAIHEMSERRQAFASSVTHELKTPLTNIRLYIEMLANGMASDLEKEQEYYHILNSESGRLSRLITNVLEFSKLDRKTRRFNIKPGNFDDVIQDVRAAMQEKLLQEGVSLIVDKKTAVEFPYDREVMVQVLINLIENSVKFGKDAPAKEITLEIEEGPKGIIVACSDQGPGIPEHALKKIFDDFYRVDNALTRTTGGTGIGLSLVKKFILALGGTIHAENLPEKGCKIVMNLPTPPPSPT